MIALTRSSKRLASGATRKVGSWKARIKTGSGAIVWNTGTADRAEAMARAKAHLAALTGSAAAPAPQSPPTHLIAEAEAAPEPAPAPPPVPEPVTFASAFAPAASPAAPSLAVTPLSPIGPPPPNALATVAGKAASTFALALLSKLVTWAGRKPAEPDDHETKLLEEGFTEVAANFFGDRELTPWGKVGAGALIAGGAMYVAGSPLPKRPPLHVVRPVTTTTEGTKDAPPADRTDDTLPTVRA